MTSEAEHRLAAADLVVVGGGAAGLAAAIGSARACPSLKIVVLEGAKRLGAKILISGGGRCNVTNAAVSADDFYGGSRRFVQRVLKAYSVEETILFFESLGVSLHEEAHGKLFPDTNKARTVLHALVGEAERRGVEILTHHRVESIQRLERGFQVECASASFRCRAAILATGGKSVPKTGSDGFGYQLARKLGHSIVPQTPALVPLLLDGPFHQSLSGIAQPVQLTLHVAGEKPLRHRGAMLWTHFGVSGPAILDISRHWLAARQQNKDVALDVDFLDQGEFSSVERSLLDWGNRHPKSLVEKMLGQHLAARVGDALCEASGIRSGTSFAELTRELRRNLVHQLVAHRLPVNDCRGYNYAEATAGGVSLDEVNSATMESRCCPRLYLVGEILDVDGRIGGFNFQWAWSTAHVAAEGIRREFSDPAALAEPVG